MLKLGRLQIQRYDVMAMLITNIWVIYMGLYLVTEKICLPNETFLFYFILSQCLQRHRS